MRKEHSKLIDQVVKNLDWDCILEVYKAFKMGVGEGSTVIPGIKRKPFGDSLKKEDIRNELKVILKHVVTGDISELSYGPWIISWMNGDWEFEEIDETEGEEYADEEDLSLVNSRLEVILAPQRIAMIVNSVKSEEFYEGESDSLKIEIMLQKALQSEDYELASKFRDILKYQNKESNSDK